MTDFRKHYQNLTIEKLVTVIEEPHRYKLKVINYCKKLLADKNQPIEAQKDIAKLVFKKRFFNYFRNGGHWTDESIRETSFFLNNNELNVCYNLAKEEYEKYISGATSNMPC
nr:hypothetical protein [uncultured Psychroserpens sp.]